MTTTRNGVTYDDQGKVLSVNLEGPDGDFLNPPTQEAWDEWQKGLEEVMAQADKLTEAEALAAVKGETRSAPAPDPYP